jgi:hypothetical protein
MGTLRSSTPLQAYAQRLVDDLLWSLKSPPLIASTKALERQSIIERAPQTEQPIPDPVFPDAAFWHEAWLSACDMISKPSTVAALQADLESERSRHRHGQLRLGLYFETLLGFWLKHSGRYEVLARHTPVVDMSGRTLGEPDWIVCNRRSKEDPTPATQHWEVAVKFYLARSLPAASDRHCPGLHSFVGPEIQGTDTLLGKLRHMLVHQLALELPLPQECGPVARVCCLKGKLFLPWKGGQVLSSSWAEHTDSLSGDEAHRDLSSHDGAWLRQLAALPLASNTPTGHWVSTEQWPAFVHAATNQATHTGWLRPGHTLTGRMLPKPYWLAPLRLNESQQLQSLEFGDLERLTTPTCIALVGDASTALCQEPGSSAASPLIEWTRCFVVPKAFTKPACAE